jgi:hypothetical protein
MCTEPNKFATDAPSCHFWVLRISHVILKVSGGVSRRWTPLAYNSVPECPESVSAIKWRRMADVTEIEALKASMRGARNAAGDLVDIGVKVEAVDPHADVADHDLDELQRLTLANAIAAQALRGLVETMLKRRGKLTEDAPAESGNAGVEE